MSALAWGTPIGAGRGTHERAPAGHVKLVAQIGCWNCWPNEMVLNAWIDAPTISRVPCPHEDKEEIQRSQIADQLVIVCLGLFRRRIHRLRFNTQEFPVLGRWLQVAPHWRQAKSLYSLSGSHPISQPSLPTRRAGRPLSTW